MSREPVGKEPRMRFVQDLEEVEPFPSVVTVGAFDGVHLGHQALIAQVVAMARATGGRAVVVTFFPHPAVVLRGETPFYLTSPEEKRRYIARLGVDLLVQLPFTPETARIRAAAFVEQLVRIGMRALWAGPDFALGYRREGTLPVLEALGRQHGYTVHVAMEFRLGGRPVRSSRIREALRQGDVRAAAACLGRPFAVSGEVIAGAGRGQRLGFPTANLAIWPEHALPADGVYACWADLPEGIRRMAVVNIGVRPTFDQSQERIVEAHLLDWHGDLYGQRVTLHFIERLREERRFPSVADLVAQIHRDVERARALLEAMAPPVPIEAE
ncbi:riboflavin kinase / FMN adenylyltransferase [Thermoflexus hugenholtzii JAD2]|uniref:Riboflavin biosynthesis protein n=2 Tax=Thermoflexus TaxID=1495649 RepID=A0A212RDE3_9CHLR|nr:riboflavin kinase / FMN adenylyltransferase [Thermoflexus hugenholtzii JAD2]